MVYLALSSEAVSEVIRLAADADCSVWVGSDAITPEEHNRLTRAGAKVTRFSFPLGEARPDIISNAMATIEEHHPGEIVWIQHVWPEATS